MAQALKENPRELGVIQPFWSIRPRFHPHVFDSVPSTNTAAWELIDQGAPSGTAVLARSQNAGRGQWGRSWQSPPGGLYLSLALQPEVPAGCSSQLTLAGAWGIATSLGNLGLPVQVKWPNDIVFQGRKLGGILTETRVEKGQITAAVVGVGLNVSNPVPPTGITWLEAARKEPRPELQPALPTQVDCATPLAAGFAPDSLEQAAAVVLYGLLQGYLFWQTHGTAALLEVYRTRLVNLGQILVLDGHQWEVQGVTQTGNLWVKDMGSKVSTAVGIRELRPGEITLGYNS
ncbi:MAG: biotin--[acetyl-CoA-carboxylase] ligase [Cyanobacteria bacterium Co-bin13]|nr:biotin--[acetyl-CoA-carboxylase] ligase [Cyanobacteria bacterium Co-bin13]